MRIYGSAQVIHKSDAAWQSLHSLFPALPGGDPAHAVVMYAETSDIEHVMIGGRFAKRDGKLVFPAERLAKLQQELLESRLRMMKEGNYVYKPAPAGPLPERYVF